MLTGGKISPHAREQKKIEEENRAAGRPIDSGTGGIVGGLRRLVREVSTESDLSYHVLTGSERHVSDDREHALGKRASESVSDSCTVPPGIGIGMATLSRIAVVPWDSHAVAPCTQGHINHFPHLVCCN